MNQREEVTGLAIVDAANVLALIDQKDERAIIEALISGPSESYIYSFTVGGKDVEGISADGAKVVVREMAKQGEFIRVLDSEVKEFDDKWIVIVRVGRYVLIDGFREQLLDVQMGTADQLKTETVTPRGQSRPVTRADPNSYRKASGKALRNAQLACVPRSFQKWFITSALAGQIVDSATPQVASRQQRELPRGGRAALPEEHPWGNGPGDFLTNAHRAFGYTPEQTLGHLGVGHANDIQDPEVAWKALEERHAAETAPAPA